MTMPADPDRELLIEQVCSAWRPTDAHGTVSSHPAWHDLPPEDRAVAYRETCKSRLMEAAMDPGGLSGTGRTVLRLIERSAGE